MIYQLTNCVIGKVMKRPSTSCKTPYVADVELENGTTVLAHTASLGCCGLADKGATVIMIPVENNKNVCKYKVMGSLGSAGSAGSAGSVIGIDPKLAETLTHHLLCLGIIPTLEKPMDIKREKTIGHSRFDFVGKDNNEQPFILEVKNVPLAKDGISYFPDGYRKRPKDPVSPRALKHIRHLEEIAIKGNTRAIMCYIIQRNDSSIFEPSNVDPIYQYAVYKAMSNGVEVLPIQIKWIFHKEKREMNAYLCGVLPIRKKKMGAVAVEEVVSVAAPVPVSAPLIASWFGGR